MTDADFALRRVRPATHPTAMIAAPEAMAADAGADVLARGGNAIDAAVTCAFVQGVVNPHDAGLGGFAVLMLQQPREDTPRLLDAPALAGARTSPDMWVDRVTADRQADWGYALAGDVNQSGYTSICTPGALRGLAEMLQRWGTISLADAVEPAARLAEDGYAVDRRVASYWQSPSPYPGMPDLLDIVRANAEASRLYQTAAGRAYMPGDVIRNPDYAATLRAIARGGPDEFYRGELGRRIAADLAAGGAFVTAEDLATYQVRDGQPTSGSYRGHTIRTAPAPHCGPTLIEILNIVEGWDLVSLGHDSPAYIWYLGMAMKAAFQDRERFLGDPDFGDVPVAWVTSKERAAWWRQRIEAGEPIESATGPAGSPGTTHISVVDGAGRCVALTHSLGGSSGVVSPGLGFMYNNSMFGFDPLPGRPNSIAPGKARLTGMTPTIVYRDDRPVLVIINHLDFGMGIQEAVYAPRFHAQGASIACQSRIPESVCAKVRTRHPIQRAPAGHGGFALVHAIQIDPTNGRLIGAADAGSDGMAIAV